MAPTRRRPGRVAAVAGDADGAHDRRVDEPAAVAVPVESVVQKPPPQPPSQVDNPMVRLAALAERIAARIPQQKRPANVVVDGYVGTFADPDIMRADGRWYAYATNTGQRHVPTLVSDDLRTWTLLGSDALPQVGSWVQGRGGGGGLWAPGIQRIGKGWTLAYSAQYGIVGGERHNCIGLARGTSPTGPFQHLGDPLACAPSSRQGVIDPDLYVDEDGTAWMLWKYSGALPAATGRHLQPTTQRRRHRLGAGLADLRGADLPGRLGGRHDREPEHDHLPRRDLPLLLGQLLHDRRLRHRLRDLRGTDRSVRSALAPAAARLRTTGHLGPGGASAFEADHSLRLAYHAWEPGRSARCAGCGSRVCGSAPT